MCNKPKTVTYWRHKTQQVMRLLDTKKYSVDLSTALVVYTECQYYLSLIHI